MKQERAMRLVKYETTKPIQKVGIESLELNVAKQKETMKVKVPKPRNHLVVPAKTKKAGKHKDKKREIKYKHIEEHV